MDKTERETLKDKTLDFLFKCPEFFKNQQSRSYPFSKEQLVMYQDFLNWNLVSQNEEIQWTEDLIKTFQDKLDWKLFTTNSAAFKDLRLLEVFEDRIDWLGDNEFEGGSIAMNYGLPWDLDFLKKYESRINFIKLSSNEAIPWTEEILDQYRERWYLDDLAFNKGIPWNLKLFEKYLSNRITEMGFYLNPRITQEIEIIEKYSELVDWVYVFSNPNLPWEEERLLERWKSRLDWYGIALNPYFFKMDSEFFYKNLERWEESNAFPALSANEALPWSIDFIREYETKWNWYTLCSNKGVPWNANMIYAFVAKVKWGGWKTKKDGTFFVPGLVKNSSLLTTIYHF